MIEPYIARVLDALALDPVLEGRARDFLRRELPRRRREIGLDRARPAPAIPPEVFAHHLFNPEVGPYWLRRAAALLLITLFIPVFFIAPLAKLGLTLFIALLIEIVPAILRRRSGDPPRIESGALHIGTGAINPAAIRRIGFARKHLFSAPFVIEYDGGQIECPRGAAWSTLLLSRLIRLLDGRVPIDPAVRDYLARASLPLRRRIIAARVFCGLVLFAGALLLGLAAVMGSVGFSPIVLIAPMGVILLALVMVNGRLMVRSELALVASLGVIAYLLASSLALMGFVEGAGHRAVGALAGAGALLVFIAALPFTPLRVDWRRVAGGLAVAAAIWGGGAAWLWRAYLPPERLHDYGGGEIRLGVALDGGGYAYVTSGRIGGESGVPLPTDTKWNKVFIWRDGQPLVQSAEVESAALSVPIWLEDTQEILFTSPGPEGFLSLRYIGVPGGAERGVDMLYESPRRLFVGLASYQISRDGSHVWLEEKIDASSTRHVIRRAADSRDVWSAVAAPPAAGAPGFIPLGWSAGHVALMLHYDNSGESLPGLRPNETVWQNPVLAAHDVSAGTSATLARLPAPLIDHRLFLKQEFLLTLTREFELQVTRWETGESQIYPNAHLLAFHSFDRFQWAPDESVLYTLAASSARRDDTHAIVPLDRIIRFDPATGEQRLIWSAPEPMRDVWVPPDGRYFLVFMESPLRLFGYECTNFYALNATDGRLLRLGPWNLGVRQRFTLPDSQYDLPLADYPRAWIIPQSIVRLGTKSLSGGLYRHSNPLLLDQQ